MSTADLAPLTVYPSADQRPDLAEVNFDHGAAQSLAGALRQAAFWTDQLADVRHRTIRWALEDAVGPWADHLRTTVALQGGECRAIAEQLRRNAGRIEDASHFALAEEGRRERARLEALALWVSPTEVTAMPIIGLTPDLPTR